MIRDQHIRRILSRRNPDEAEASVKQQVSSSRNDQDFECGRSLFPEESKTLSEFIGSPAVSAIPVVSW